jgi:hypothetical protein
MQSRRVAGKGTRHAPRPRLPGAPDLRSERYVGSQGPGHPPRSHLLLDPRLQGWDVPDICANKGFRPHLRTVRRGALQSRPRQQRLVHQVRARAIPAEHRIHRLHELRQGTLPGSGGTRDVQGVCHRSLPGAAPSRCPFLHGLPCWHLSGHDRRRCMHQVQLQLRCRPLSRRLWPVEGRCVPVMPQRALQGRCGHPGLLGVRYWEVY